MTQSIGKWDIGIYLGEGGFSVVYLGTDQETNVTVALKILKKNSQNSLDRKKIEQEIDSMKKVDHSNVVNLIEHQVGVTFRNKKVDLVVLEYASGGELFDYLSMTGHFEEAVCRTYFNQFMDGLKACHDMGICHRDLKPENLLLDGDYQLKIADFGFAHSVNTKMITECGTKAYIAPEIIQKKKNKGYDGTLSDVWSSGVVLFIMASGFPPYQTPDPTTDWWFHKLVTKRLSLFWKAHGRQMYFTEDFKDLYNKMSIIDPENRISISDIMQHPWYTSGILTPTALKKTMAKRHVKVEENNRIVRIKKEKEQALQGFQTSDILVKGDHDDENSFDPQSDELPENSTGSIILAMESGEMNDDDGDDDGENEIEIDDEELTMGSDFLSDVEEKQDKEAAPVYIPTRTVLTKIDCQASPDDVLSMLKNKLSNVAGCDVTVEGYELTAMINTMNGKIQFVANVYTHQKDPKRSICEFQRRQGSSVAFRSQYAELRKQMDSLAYKPVRVELDRTDGVDQVEE